MKNKVIQVLFYGGKKVKAPKNLRKDTATLRNVKNVTFLNPLFQGLAFRTCPPSAQLVNGTLHVQEITQLQIWKHFYSILRMTH